jgi:hypothetical protein
MVPRGLVALFGQAEPRAFLFEQSFFHGGYLEGWLRNGLRMAISVVFLGRIVRPG